MYDSGVCVCVCDIYYGILCTLFICTLCICMTRLYVSVTLLVSVSVSVIVSVSVPVPVCVHSIRHRVLPRQIPYVMYLIYTYIIWVGYDE